MATQLKRKAVDVRSLRLVTDEQFVKDAKMLLGYDVLEDALALRKTAEILKKQNIQPFDNAKVEAYKREKAESVRSRKQRTNRYTGDVTETRVRGEWENFNLHGYEREIPAFALLRAAAVKKALNAAKVGANFEVEELRLHTTKRTREHRIVDPFMVLVVGKTRLYIDVWDEPKFEGRRVK